MAKQYIGTYELDTYTRSEAKKDLEETFSHHFNHFTRENLRGVKPMKFKGQNVQATSANSTIQSLGPMQGYFWRIMRIGVYSSGTDIGAVRLFSSADPSVTTVDHIIDSLTVQTAYYPRGLWLWPGEQLYATFASVSGNTYSLNGAAIEVPAEMAGKLLV